jgi:uncharacterized protein (DUF952 family)
MIYHIVKEKDFLSQNRDNNYLPSDFDQYGFIHCSSGESVIPVANDYYRNAGDIVLLLRIDQSKLRSQTKYEPAVPLNDAGTQHVNSSPVFPHVYGPIENSAIESIGILTEEKGSYVWPNKFLPLADYLSRKRNVTS